MSPSEALSMRRDLDQSWLTWSALNHLLPAPILRELFVVILDKVSGNELTLDNLFEELAISGPAGLESWYVRIRKVQEPLAVYLQHRLQHLLWRNDSDAYPPDSDLRPSDRSIVPNNLEVAIQIGRSDFGTDWDLARITPPRGESNLDKLVELIRYGKTLSDEGQLNQLPIKAQATLADSPTIVAIAIAKHLGDLCADADAWQPAKALYETAQERLPTIGHDEWYPFVSGMKDILYQSIANALRATEGAGQTFALLHQGLESNSLRERPVLVTNAGFDALTAQIATGSFHHDDRRATLLAPTYSHDSYGLDSIWSYLNDRNFPSAQRQCWSVLRRQIALGLASETRATKSVFGRVILAGLEELNQHDAGSFRLSVRLLLESGDTAIGKLSWTQGIVDRYVNSNAVSDLSKAARRHVGLRLERERVAIEILRGWLLRVSGDKEDVADNIMGYLTESAHTGAVTSVGNHDLGGRSLEILKDIAKARPEFLGRSAAKLEAAINAKLKSQEFWRGKSNAIELAIECADDFSPEQIDRLVQSILGILDAQNPAAQMWPIVRPALEFLTCKPAVILYLSDPTLARRVLETILRFGMQETQSSQLIFHLRNFDPMLLRDPRIVATLESTVADLRKKALTVNSSGTAGEIQALLLSPSISGIDGVRDALAALRVVIASCHDKRPRMALAYSYVSIQMLAHRQQTFADELHLPRQKIDAMWNEVYEAIVDFWDQIAKRPGLLASFSFIPREESNPVLVHNWAFASLRFAESLDRRDEMREFIARAGEKQDSLRSAIQRALVIGATVDTDVAISPGEIEDEAPDVFYDGLGRRLIVMESLAPPAAAALCGVLLQQCMRFGPRGLDAAVLVCASRQGLAEKLNQALAANYVKRVDADRDLRLSLLPLLNALKVHVR